MEACVNCKKLAEQIEELRSAFEKRFIDRVSQVQDSVVKEHKRIHADTDPVLRAAKKVVVDYELFGLHSPNLRTLIMTLRAALAKSERMKVLIEGEMTLHD